MTLVQMQYFAMVCQCQNISMAAKMLYISQPALSASLADLEKEVGFKLFNRKSKGVIPTEESLLLLSHVKAVLKRADLLHKELPLISINQNLIRIGFRPYGGESSFLTCYQAFEKMHPEIVLKINEMSNTTPYIFLEEEQIDILISSMKPMPEDWAKKYERCRIGTEHVSLFCQSGSPLAQIEAPTLEDVLAYPFIFWEGHQKLYQRMEAHASQMDLTLQLGALLPQVGGVLEFICHDLGIGFLTGTYIDQIQSLHRIEIPDEMLDLMEGDRDIPIYAFWKKETETYQTKKLLIDFLKEHSFELETAE